MSLLFSNEQLQAAHERVLVKVAEERRRQHERNLAAAREREQQRDLEGQRRPREVQLVSGIPYQVRSELQWEARAHQSFDLRIGEKRKKSRATVPVAASPEITLTLSTSGTVLAKPRRPRKKKTTAFVTSGNVPPSTTTDVQPE